MSPHSSSPTASTRRSTPTSRSSTREMEKIWERIWVYCGHESQVPNPGDYYAVTIGRQPMIMVRQADGSVQVLYNRCPHRGVQVVGNLKGNTGSAFVCSYHAWSFHLDGSVRAIPLAKGYEGTRMTRDNPDCGMKRAARVDSYRGFVFASLADDGPSLTEFLGEAQDRVRRHVRPLAARRGRGRADLPPRDAALELEVLHGEPARCAASVGDAPVDRHLGRPGREAPQGREGRGAALLPLPVDLRVELRAVGRRADDQLPARPRHPEGLHGPAPARPGHARVRGAAEAGLRRGEDRGVPVAQHPPRAGLSVPLGAVAAAAAALPAAGRRPTRRCRRSGTSA